MMRRMGTTLVILSAMMGPSSIAWAHYPHYPGTASASEGFRQMDWTSPVVSRVLTQGWVDTLGLSFIWPRPESATVKKIDGKTCLVGGFFSFDVDDHFAFDVDETIELEIEVEAATTSTLILDYDRHGATRPLQEIVIKNDEVTGRWHKEMIKLDRARFANFGQYGTDIAIASAGAAVTPDPKQSFDPSKPHSMTLCSLTLRRSNTTEKPQKFGWLDMQITDETGVKTPARVGIYDDANRAPIPSDQALQIQRYGDQTRMVRLRSWGPGRTEPWPNENRSVFFSDGQYRARLPIGKYEVIVSKGLEYGIEKQTINVTAEVTTTTKVNLKRAAHMEQKGWVSGDGHMHFDRHAKVDNDGLLSIAEAQDINVMNLLQMGNLTDITFPQYAFGEEGRAQRGNYALVSGQEDPRSGQRGHTLHLNVKEYYRDQDYFAYHKVFEEMRRQGAVSGYAHFGEGHFNEWHGMAVDAPFDLVDIVEVLQFGALNLDLWYDFLNLGFKLTPSAGSDWPYGNLPGTERNYVKSTTAKDVSAWYTNLKAGRSFVTNGPMLEFTANGQPPGSELTLKRGDVLKVVASASQNPDYDTLDRLEIVVNGDVVATADKSDEAGNLTITHDIRLDHGQWVAVRAWGHGYAKAHSAPVYVVVDGDPSWRRQDVPALVEKMRGAITALVEKPANALLELEYWDTHGQFEKTWNKQLPALRERVKAADKFYQDLAKRARSQ